jgi:hypothetical protein
MALQSYKTKDGLKVPGVTTVIGQNLGWSKDALMYWAWQEGTEGRNFRETSQSATDAGTIAHDLIECNIKGRDFDDKPYFLLDNLDDLMEKAHKCLDNFIHWKSQISFDVIATETKIVSEALRYGGMLDCVARVNGVVCLFDWKSSKAIYGDYWIQVAAYVNLWNETHDDKMEGAQLLRIDKNGDAWDFHYKGDLSKYFEAFKYLRGLERLRKELK